MKRKQRDEAEDLSTTSTPSKSRRLDHTPNTTPSKPTRRILRFDVQSSDRRGEQHSAQVQQKATTSVSSTPSKNKSTPTKARIETPSKANNSARRKSAGRLLQRDDFDEEENGFSDEHTVAQQIWNAGSGEGDDQDQDEEQGSEDDLESEQDELATQPATDTPSKLKGGRPKGSKNRRRSVTPPRNLPPHEHYFFQNRPGGTKTSNNKLSSVSLLSHEEYHEAMQTFRDPHQGELSFLQDMHAQSFEQWVLELQQGFNICLYGWGSKRKLVDSFASDFLNEPQEGDTRPIIIGIRGYRSNLSLRDILPTIANTIPTLKNVKLPANPSDAIDLILAILDELYSGKMRLPHRYLMVHSIDSPSLRRPATQSFLARLASSKHISLLATADNPNFPLLWDLGLRNRFNFLFHDATTFAHFDDEIDGGREGGGVVDEVNALLGRSGRKVHGKEGVIYVLRSLTESARRLYSMLVAEVLSIEEGETTAPNGEEAGDAAKDHMDQEATSAIEYRSLYRKAVGQLIATNEIQFRQLLKEFYDHEMVVGHRERDGSEFIGIPFRREECMSILEELQGL
ncbi:MAG: Origin recognition complex subunit 2 [Alyxoria varia]|nr:MAG: Origin recognition complex subunit 2 [Alyxoria varia]